MNVLIHNFGDLPVFFNNNAWANATKAAAHFGKRLDNYFDNLDTKEYMEIVKEDLGVTDNASIVLAKRGNYGGTWMHPDLLVHFSRWLNPRFGHWADKQVKFILSSSKNYSEWVRYRHGAASSNKLLNGVIKRVYAEVGIVATADHYRKEALMINEVLTGEYRRINRDKLSIRKLDLLCILEIECATLFCLRLSDSRRKWLINQRANDWYANRR